MSYLQRIQEMEDVSSQIEAAFNNERRAVQLLGRLAELGASLDGSNCHHLTSFYKETQTYWHSLIRDKLST